MDAAAAAMVEVIGVRVWLFWLSVGGCGRACSGGRGIGSGSGKGNGGDDDLVVTVDVVADSGEGSLGSVTINNGRVGKLAVGSDK